MFSGRSRETSTRVCIRGVLGCRLNGGKAVKQGKQSKSHAERGFDREHNGSFISFLYNVRYGELNGRVGIQGDDRLEVVSRQTYPMLRLEICLINWK